MKFNLQYSDIYQYQRTQFKIVIQLHHLARLTMTDSLNTTDLTRSQSGFCTKEWDQKGTQVDLTDVWGSMTNQTDSKIDILSLNSL